MISVVKTKLGILWSSLFSAIIQLHDPNVNGTIFYWDSYRAPLRVESILKHGPIADQGGGHGRQDSRFYPTVYYSPPFCGESL